MCDISILRQCRSWVYSILKWDNLFHVQTTLDSHFSHPVFIAPLQSSKLACGAFPAPKKSPEKKKKKIFRSPGQLPEACFWSGSEVKFVKPPKVRRPLPPHDRNKCPIGERIQCGCCCWPTLCFRTV